jgi:hypothetical protein
MSKPMTFPEFGELMKYIAANNSPVNFTHGRRSVKYVDPHFDMRFNTVFAVTLRGFGFEDTLFHTQNECRDLPQSLFERIKEFLDTPMR